MNQVIDFIMNNYVWILAIILLILLAIIGSYADKTNFGQGKKNIESNIQKIRLSDVVNLSKTNNNDNIVKTNQNVINYNDNIVKTNNENGVTNNQIVNNNLNLSTNQASTNGMNLSTNSNLQDTMATNDLEVNKVPIMKSLEEKLNNLDFEIKSALPEKETINTDLLDDISNLSFESNSKVNFNSNNNVSSSFDDLELPTIKSLRK